MNKKIFIGGTGRSGTTILSKYLGSHRDIYRIPYESRFIIDKGGLIDLFYSLTQNYSIDQSRIAIRDFVNLFERDLITPYNAPYLGIDFLKIIEQDIYYERLGYLIDKINDGKFYGWDYHTSEKDRIIHYLFRRYFKTIDRYYNAFNRKVLNIDKGLPIYRKPMEHMYIGKYFVNPDELYDIFGEFVNDIFLSIANTQNKHNWCEDTPANILHIEFLNQLFEEVYFIHIVRNPIGVAYSIKNQLWAPNEYNKIVPFLKNIYEKLIDIKEKIRHTNIKFIEIKLEDIAKNMRLYNKEIINFLGIDDNFNDSIQIKEEKVNYYMNKITKKDYEYLYNGLKKYLDHYQYE